MASLASIALYATLGVKSNSVLVFLRKQDSSPGSKHETGCSGLVHWDDPEGWDGEGGRREDQGGEHTYTHGWFMSMCGKNHYNTVK